jgi:hypothetical protein
MNPSACPYTTELAERVMSNFDHEIDKDAARHLRDEEVFSRYSGWNFNGLVWWDRVADEWKCEVWTYGNPRAVVGAFTLEEIMQKVSDKFGWD